MIWTASVMILTMSSAGRQIATIPAGRHRKRRLVAVVVFYVAAIDLAVSLHNLATR